MGTVLFYHLTRRPLEETLAMLLEKARGAGMRVLVRGTSRQRMEWLDEKLWLGPEEAFLPHGLDGGPHDALQPVLLTTSGTACENGCLMTVDGAPVSVEDISGAARVCVLFDGNDAAALATARAQWKALKDAGVAAQYWSEESGRWEKKAET